MGHLINIEMFLMNAYVSIKNPFFSNNKVNNAPPIKDDNSPDTYADLNPWHGNEKILLSWPIRNLANSCSADIRADNLGATENDATGDTPTEEPPLPDFLLETKNETVTRPDGKNCEVKTGIEVKNGKLSLYDQGCSEMSWKSNRRFTLDLNSGNISFSVSPGMSMGGAPEAWEIYGGKDDVKFNNNPTGYLEVLKRMKGWVEDLQKENPDKKEYFDKVLGYLVKLHDKHAVTGLQNIPPDYYKYIMQGDAKGNFNQTLDSKEEAQEAATAFCAEYNERFSLTENASRCRAFLDYLYDQNKAFVITARIGSGVEMYTEPNQSLPTDKLYALEITNKFDDQHNNQTSNKTYGAVIAHLMLVYGESFHADIYLLFLNYDSNERKKAVKRLKARDIYSKIEKDRAKYLLLETIGRFFDDETNRKFLQLSDASRALGYGNLWQNVYESYQKKGVFRKSAKELVSRPEVKNNLSVLKTLSAKELERFLDVIANIKYYGYVTDAGGRANEDISLFAKAETLSTLFTVIELFDRAGFKRSHYCLESDAVVVQNNGECVVADDFARALVYSNAATDFLIEKASAGTVDEQAKAYYLLRTQSIDNPTSMSDENIIKIVMLNKYGFDCSKILFNLRNRIFPLYKKTMTSTTEESDEILRTKFSSLLVDFLHELINNKKEVFFSNVELDCLFQHFYCLDKTIYALSVRLNKKLLPYLKNNLSSTDNHVRGVSCYALFSIFVNYDDTLIGDDLIPLLIQNINSPYSDGVETHTPGGHESGPLENLYAAELLVRLGNRAVPYLKRALHSQDKETVETIKIVLEETTPSEEQIYQKSLPQNDFTPISIDEAISNYCQSDITNEAKCIEALRKPLVYADAKGNFDNKIDEGELNTFIIEMIKSGSSQFEGFLKVNDLTINTASLIDTIALHAASLSDKKVVRRLLLFVTREIDPSDLNGRIAKLSYLTHCHKEIESNKCDKNGDCEWNYDEQAQVSKKIEELWDEIGDENLKPILKDLDFIIIPQPSIKSIKKASSLNTNDSTYKYSVVFSFDELPKNTNKIGIEVGGYPQKTIDISDNNISANIWLVTYNKENDCEIFFYDKDGRGIGKTKPFNISNPDAD